MSESSLIRYRQDELPELREEFIAKHLRTWETRGRGWGVFHVPVELEPPFCHFSHLLDAPEKPVFDDGRRESFFSRLTEKKPPDNSLLLESYRRELVSYGEDLAQEFEPYFCRYYNEEFVELRLIFPKDLKVSRSASENLLVSFSYLSFPVSFEVIGSRDEIIIQFACTRKDLSQVREQIGAHLPNCSLEQTSDYLSDLWVGGDTSELIVDFGLSNEFCLPLKTPPETDFLVTIIGALADLSGDEIGVVQILFQKTREDWAGELIDAINYFEGTSPFSDTRHLTALAKEKLRSPLFAASLRVGGKSIDEQRTWQIVRSLGSGLAHLTNPTGNELIPLSKGDLGDEYRAQALLNRQSFRCGMLLNSSELVALVHPPAESVRSEKLLRETGKTKAAPPIAVGNTGNRIILGENIHQNTVTEVSLSNEQRTRHLHLIGASGSGKSNLLLNLIKQDLQNNQGICVIDPHGDLIDEVIANIPASRIKDVVLFDPADAEFPIGFNILQAKSELEKTLLASDLIATFRRMATSWGDVMDSVLANAILAFVESTRGGTLFDLKRFLVEKDFRNDFLKTVGDYGVTYFWRNEFPQITGKPQSSILIRLDTFLRQKLIRNIVCQKENKIDFRRIMDEKKVLLIKLSQGLIGEENSHLLGTLLVAKLHQTALSRQDASSRPFFALYMDEFHHFITPSLESVLSGVRKYNLGLVLAHQEFRQLQSRNSEVASSVLSNCSTRICFRLGDRDAEKFASGFSFFDAKALQNLSIGEAIGRVERSDYDFNLTTSLVPKIREEIAGKIKQAVTQSSREKYSKPKTEVEAEIEKIISFESVQPKRMTTDIRGSSQRKSSQIEKSAELVFREKKREEVPVSNAEVAPAISSPQIPVNSKSAAVSPSSSDEKHQDNGNQQHSYLQSLIKRIAENAGFLARLESPVFGGAGRIDVALERTNLKIACEVSVSNSPDYELSNIQKCLASNYSPVLMVSSNARHLGKIKTLAQETLESEDFKKVLFLTPEETFTFFEQFEADKTEEKVKGYKVNLKLRPIEEDERKGHKRAISDVILGAIKRLKKHSD